MRPSLCLTLLSLLALSGVSAWPCTAFLYTDGRTVLAGNNEDGDNPNLLMRVIPPQNGKFGHIFFGFDDYSTQGGVNEAGLFFDGFGLSQRDVPADKELFPGDFFGTVLAECATVEDVVRFLDRYRIPFLGGSQFLFGDKTGDSVIVESGGLIRKKGNYQIATNFRYSDLAPGEESTFERYTLTRDALRTAEVSVNAARRILAAVHQEAGDKSLYSNIYDLTHGTIYLNYFHNFENAAVIDVHEEVRKGAHIVPLETLFPPTHAALQYKRAKADELRKSVEARLDKTVDPSSYDPLAGRYEISVAEMRRAFPDAAPLLEDKPLVFTVHRDGDRLLAEHSLLPLQMEIVPESAGRFFSIGMYNAYQFAFLRNDTGAISRMEVEFAGKKMVAQKTQ